MTLVDPYFQLEKKIMALDPSIPLASNTNGIDVGKLMSIAQFARQMHQEQQADQTKNALKQIFMAPDAFDPQTNQLSPNTLKRVMQVDPETGMKLQSDMLDTQMKQAQIFHSKTEAGKMSFDAMTASAGAGIDAYDAAIKAGRPEEDANHIGTISRNEAIDNSAGLISEDDKQRAKSSPFDPKTARAFAGLNKEWSGAKEKISDDVERNRHDLAMEKNAGERVQIQLQNQAPTGGENDDQALDYAAQIYREKGTLPTLGMGKAGAQFRMKVIQRAAQQAAAQGGSAATDIGTQSAIKGDTSSLTNISRIADSAEAYENTALENMKIVREKMPKGAVTVGPWLGKWIQSGRVGLGGADVPPYATALITVANEYAKVMSGSTGAQGSTVDSRREAAEMLNAAQTPEQVNSVLDVMSRDMQNKKNSYRAQRESIQERIKGAGTPSKETKDPDAKPKEAAASIATPSSKEEFDALPKGAKYRKPTDPEGAFRVKGVGGQ